MSSSSPNLIQISRHNPQLLGSKAFEQATFGHQETLETQSMSNQSLHAASLQQQSHPRTANPSSRSSIAQSQQALQQRPSSTSTAALFSQVNDPRETMSAQSSQVDPQQFQNLFEQMQSNHDFLEKMQGLLAMYPLNTESSSDEFNHSLILKSLQNLAPHTARNRQSLNFNEEILKSQASSDQTLLKQNSSDDIYVSARNPILEVQLQRVESNQQPAYTKESMEYSQTPTASQLKFRHITPITTGSYDAQLLSNPTIFTQNSQAKNLFQEQFSQEQESLQEAANMGQQMSNQQQLQYQFCVNEGAYDMMQDQFHTPIQNTGSRIMGIRAAQQQQQIQYQSPEQNGVMKNGVIGNFDPIQIGPEYFQMFNQFYQMFQQVQAQTQIDLSNDPQFIQNMMLQYFTFMTQNGGIDNQLSPQRPAYQNLPLAAIPESKDSILEENSGWQTVQTTKLALSAITNNNQNPMSCNCCKNCQDMKRLGSYQNYQQCSNFNLGSLQGGYQNSQYLNQETFIQKSDISGSQILQNQFGGYGSQSPSPLIKQPTPYVSVMQHYNSNPCMVVNQPNFLMDPCQNQMSAYQSRKDSLQSDLPTDIVIQPTNLQNLYSQNTVIANEQLQEQVRALSPCQQNVCQATQKNGIILSPKQIHENKLIEYMIENNDFSNYKQRCDVIKGKRMSRTLSRSNSKNNTMLRLHQHKLSIQSSFINHQNNHTQRFSNNFGLNNYNSSKEYQNVQFLSDHKQYTAEEEPGSKKLSFPNDQKALLFFSPQLQGRQQLSQIDYDLNEDGIYKRDFNLIKSGQVQLQAFERGSAQNFYSHRDYQIGSLAHADDLLKGISSPVSERYDRDSNLILSDQRRFTGESGGAGPSKQRQRTLEKIQQIRKLNEQQRSKEKNAKKSSARQNLHKQATNGQQSNQVKQVFEIKDLKSKSKGRKQNQHFRKQSQNVQSNKENNKLIQSNIYHQYEMSQQNIALSPQQDMLLASMEQECRKKDSNTFKSLNSVANRNPQTSDFQEEFSSPPLNHIKLKLDNHLKNQLQPTHVQPFNSSQIFQMQAHSSSSSQVDLNLFQEKQEDLKKPGVEVHIIKKPVQTEEFKKIQEKLNRYYQDKTKAENQKAVDANTQRVVDPRAQKIALQKIQSYETGGRNSQIFAANQNFNTNNDFEGNSMTKTLSSFKSLMMKTMSQMSLQQENNIQNQFQNGKDQRKKAQSKLVHGGMVYNQSVNVSSIQDDYSVGVDYSENLTKIMSPQNLYNGKLGNIKQRNPVAPAESSNIEQTRLNERAQIDQDQSNKKQSCLPNSLFFKEKKQLAFQAPGQAHQLKKHSNEDTLSLKYNSRPPSLCYCGQTNCICAQDSKKDLLSHFQNFLQEMDKHPHFNQNGFPLHRESLYHSPIENIRHSSSTNDFFLSNFQFINNGQVYRSSSQNSRLSKNRGPQMNRQSSVSASTNNLLGQPKMKRFSSGATLTNLPFKKINNQNLNHCQSTQVFPHLKKISLDSEAERSANENKTAADIIVQQIRDANCNSSEGVSCSPSKITAATQEQLERLDTNQEEELRLLNIENDIMQKAFIQKSHRLNLQDSQRNELLQRIQHYKKQQISNQPHEAKITGGGYSTLHDDNQNSHLQVVNGSTQNTSHVTANGYQSSNNHSGNHSSNQTKMNLSTQQFQSQGGQSAETQQNAQKKNQNSYNLMISLEERRKMEKYKKKLEIINQIQIDREQEIKKFKDCL